MTPRAEVGPPCLTANGPRLRYNTAAPSAKQAAFLSLTNKECLFGGSAGSGKSYSLLLAALQFCDVPGYSALLLRRTLADLKLPGSLIPMSREMLEGRATYNANDYKWTFPSGAVIQFGYLQNPGDELRYQGSQLQFCGFDELTQFPNEDQYLYLFSRLRRPVMPREEMASFYGQSPDGLTLADIPLRMRAATNPGGPGSAWTKKRFVDPDTAKAPFLPARFYDNPAIPPEEYREALALLGEVQRRRLELGDWSVAEEEGALWKFEDIKRVEEPPLFSVKIMAVDGSVGSGSGDECGIVVGGITEDGTVVVLEDLSMRGHPDDWSKRAILGYHNHGCTRLVIEANQGGELNRIALNNAADVLKASRPHILTPRANAGESKERRAMPVAQAYRAGKVKHGPLMLDSGLEAQMVAWVPGDKRSVPSPDRVDALVWMVRELLFKVTAGPAPRSAAKEQLSTWGRQQGRKTALG